MLRKLLTRLLSNLLLIPLTAFLVYQAITLMPFSVDTEAKQETLASVSRQLQADLGVGEAWGFLRPWQKLWRGERLGDGPRAYTAKDIRRALFGSLRVGGMGLVLAGFLGLSFAMARLAWERRRAGAWRTAGLLLELVPTLVYGTPTFIIAPS